MTSEVVNHKLTPETFPGVLNMLNSLDKENATVAFAGLEKLEFGPNMAYIIMLLKMSTSEESVWEKEAPKCFSSLKTAGFVGDGFITYKKVFKTLMESKVPGEDIQFFFNMFANELRNEMIALGYDIIENVEVKLELKPAFYDAKS